MADAKLADKIEKILRYTGQEHQADAAMKGGDDPEWPIWYAEHCIDKLREVVEHPEMTKSEMIHLLVQASEELAMRAPGSDWAKFYAEFFARRYGRR